MLSSLPILQCSCDWVLKLLSCSRDLNAKGGKKNSKQLSEFQAEFQTLPSHLSEPVLPKKEVLTDSSYTIFLNRTNNRFFRAQCKMKTWGALFKNYSEFQDSRIRALNEEPY